jgi:hypothetical protein
MDETKETQENSLQEKETASKGSEGTTPTEKAKTQYTQEEVDKLLQADRIKRGRDDKTLTNRGADLDAREEAVKAREAKADELERQQDAAELAAARGDPVKLAVYQAKQADKTRAKSLNEREAAIVKREQEQTRKEAEHAETVKSTQQTQLEMKLYEIAAKHEINPEELKKGMAELNLTTAEQVESLAKRIKPTGERPLAGEGEGEGKPTTPVSVPTTSGRTGKLTPEQFEKLPIEEKRRYLEKK